MNASLTTFIDGLERLESLEDLRALFADFIGSLGMSVFTYAALRSSLQGQDDDTRTLISSYPIDWQTLYQSEALEHIDPVIAHATRSVVPVIWDDLLSSPTVRSEQRAIFQEARQFGLMHGMTVPVHGQRDFAIVSLASDLSDREFRNSIGETRHLAHLGSLYYHERVSALRHPKMRDGTVQLSRRECECLLWAARGKTAWETGEILHLSEHTVKQYLKSAMERLGVKSKPQAVVKAIMLYLIFP